MIYRVIRRSRKWRAPLSALVLLLVSTTMAQTATAETGSTDVTVQVLQTLTLTSDTSVADLSVDPSDGGAASSSQVVVTVNVLTNSGSGYTLYVNDEDTGLYDRSQDYEIPRVGSEGSPQHAEPSFGNPSFGVSADLSSGGEYAGSECVLIGDFESETWNPYCPSATGLCTRGGPTPAADVVKLTNQVAVDYDIPSGTYSDTIWYTAAAGY